MEGRTEGRRDGGTEGGRDEYVFLRSFLFRLRIILILERKTKRHRFRRRAASSGKDGPGGREGGREGGTKGQRDRGKTREGNTLFSGARAVRMREKSISSKNE